MSKLIPTGKRNPCELCGDVSRKCRQSNKDPDYIQCMTLTDAIHSGGGWAFLGATRDGAWGQWRRQGEQTDQDRAAWQEKRAAARAERQASDKAIRAKALTPRLLDKAYRAILEQLELSPRDRTDLMLRGFTPRQIEQSGFKSYSPGQSLRGNLPSNLPGLLPGGKLIALHSGYLCPARNHRGQIEGLQIRFTDSDADGDRYRWASSEVCPVSGRSGQNPLATFWPPSDCTAITLPGHHHSQPPPKIALVEGIGSKPFLASQRLKLPTVGAAGGQWLVNDGEGPQRLAAELDGLGAVPGQTTIVLFPDSGWADNKLVRKAYKKVIAWLEKIGYETKIADWGQALKTEHWVQGNGFKIARPIGSIDDISADLIKQIILYDWAGEKSIFSKVIQPQIDHRRYQKLIGFTADRATHTIDTSGGFLDPAQMLEIFSQTGLCFLLSAKGSGKSWAALLPTIKHFAAQGKRVLSIGARVNIQREQAQKYGMTFANDTTENLESCQLVSLNFDSLHKVRGQKFDLIFIDESETVTDHERTSSTCRKRRAELLAIQRQLFRDCLDDGGTVIAADADLSDIGIDFLSGVAGTSPAAIVHNLALPPKRTVYYTSSRRLLWDAFATAVLHQAERIMRDGYGPGCCEILGSDSQARLEDTQVALEKIINEAKKSGDDIDFSDAEIDSLEEVIELKFPGLLDAHPIIRIDRKTSSDKAIQRIISQPNSEIERIQPLALLFSPTAFQAISIESDYLSGRVFCVANGVVEPRAIRQFLGRDRRAKTWITSIAHSLSLPVYPGITSFDPEEIAKQIDAMARENVGGDGDTDRAGQTLNIAKWKIFNDPEGAQTVKRIYEELNSIVDGDVLAETPESRYWCQLNARKNYARKHFRDCLIEELKSEGHDLIEIAPDNADHLSAIVGFSVELDQLADIKAEQNAAREARELRDAGEIYKGAISGMELSEARAILGDPATGNDEWLQARGVVLRCEFPGLILTQIDEGVINRIEIWAMSEQPDPQIALIREHFVSDRAAAGQAKKLWAVGNMPAAKRLHSLLQSPTLARATDGRAVLADDFGGNFANLRAIAQIIPPEFLERAITPGQPGDGNCKPMGNDDPLCKALAKNWWKLSDRQRTALGFNFSQGQANRLKLSKACFKILGITFELDKSRRDGWIFTARPSEAVLAMGAAYAQFAAGEIERMELPAPQPQGAEWVGDFATALADEACQGSAIAAANEIDQVLDAVGQDAGQFVAKAAAAALPADAIAMFSKGWRAKRAKPKPKPKAKITAA